MSHNPASESKPTTYNLLFVCTGNTCRSPMAEAVARRSLRRRNWRHVQVASAGIGVRAADPATAQAIEAAAAEGMDLSGHQARQFDSALAEWADLILAMGYSHLHFIRETEASDKAFLLGDFSAGGEGEGRPVLDPFGAGIDVYERTLAELSGLVEDVLDRLVPILEP